MPRAGVPATEEEKSAAAGAGGVEAGAARMLLCVVREGEPGVAMATWGAGKGGKKRERNFRCQVGRIQF